MFKMSHLNGLHQTHLKPQTVFKFVYISLYEYHLKLISTPKINFYRHIEAGKFKSKLR